MGWQVSCLLAWVHLYLQRHVFALLVVTWVHAVSINGRLFTADAAMHCAMTFRSVPRVHCLIPQLWVYWSVVSRVHCVFCNLSTLAWLSVALRPVRHLWDRYKSRNFFAFGLVLTRMVLVRLLVMIWICVAEAWFTWTDFTVNIVIEWMTDCVWLLRFGLS